jgi:hypothetical protein
VPTRNRRCQVRLDLQTEREFEVAKGAGTQPACFKKEKAAGLIKAAAV